MRLNLEACDVAIEALKSQETGTIAEENVGIALKADAHEDRIQRLHKLTLKNCSVGDSL
jgi:uncharacterized OsmC-like protein